MIIEFDESELKEDEQEAATRYYDWFVLAERDQYLFQTLNSGS